MLISKIDDGIHVDYETLKGRFLHILTSYIFGITMTLVQFRRYSTNGIR